MPIVMPMRRSTATTSVTGMRPSPDNGWAFATYRNYVAGYTRFLEQFDQDAARFPAIRSAVTGSARNRMAPLDKIKPRVEIVRAFRNAWATEITMALPRVSDMGDDRFVAAALHWLGPQAYYAVFQGGLGTIAAKGAPLPETHHTFLSSIHSQFTEQNMLPAPWNGTCDKGWTTGGHVYGGCLAQSKPAPNSSYPGTLDDAAGAICTALKTTRDRRFDDVKEELIEKKRIKTKAGKPAKRMPMDRQRVEYQEMTCTTMFDFLYRLRIRSHYRDADTFLSPNIGDVTTYYDDLLALTRSTLHALESLAVLAVGEAWFRDQLVTFSNRRLPAFAKQHSVLGRWQELI